MATVRFDKTFLTDFEQSSKAEFLETNELGAYCSYTVAGVNTRKYHGDFVIRQPQIDTHSYVLLNALHELVNVNNNIYELGVHQYPFKAHPEGYLHKVSFELEKIPTWIFEVEGNLIQKELQFVPAKNQLLVRYSLLSGEEVNLGLRPFSSFRRIHKIKKADVSFVQLEEVEHGIGYCMQGGFDHLYIQTNHGNEFVNKGDWHYKAEYLEELNRGYDFQEDLFSVGVLLTKLQKGKPLVVSVSNQEEKVKSLNTTFNKILNAKPVLNSLEDYLEKAADQFISKTKDRGFEICAGYHWFGRWGRDTFIALPGLTLYRRNPNPDACKKVLKTMLKDLHRGLLTNIGVGEAARYNSADASLWFFWALQEYVDFTDSAATTWKSFKKEINHILDNYKEGTLYNIHMEENGLLYGGQEDVALTWMDAMVDGFPVTPRAGYTVELNALWYNAICFSLEMAEAAGDVDFFEKWVDIPRNLKVAFKELFWDEKKGYLADACEEGEKDWSFRPNQAFATSLKYPICDAEMSRSILEQIKERLLTPKGLRTLAQDDPKYIGVYQGDQKTRDSSYHQGIVWPWLLGHFAKGYLVNFGESALPLLRNILGQFEEDLSTYGLGSVAEIYDAEPPYKAKGTISQAWSVSELLRINLLVKQSSKTTR